MKVIICSQIRRLPDRRSSPPGISPEIADLRKCTINANELARFLRIFPCLQFVDLRDPTIPSDYDKINAVKNYFPGVAILAAQCRKVKQNYYYYHYNQDKLETSCINIDTDTDTDTSTTTTASTAFTLTDKPDIDPATSYAATAENAVVPKTEYPLAKTPRGKKEKEKEKETLQTLSSSGL